ncbi:hypothetical protein PTKIN_Ptkin10aG0092600 [Pterospermum kingtungense]
MICLMFFNSGLCTATLIFYTCVWIPYLELKRGLLKLLGFVFPWYQAEKKWQVNSNICQLPGVRFEDLKHSKCCSGGGLRSTGNDGEVEEVVCPICLVEMEKEDVVSQLQKCGHIFHMKCIEKWLDCHHFTCPLCRSFLLANINSSHAKCGTTR